MIAAPAGGTIERMLGPSTALTAPLAVGRYVLSLAQPSPVDEPPVDRCAVCSGVVPRGSGRLTVRGFVFHRDCAGYGVRRQALEERRGRQRPPARLSLL
ncbi:MAG: hypothetical protein M3370_09600 [Actinomycetota bacterium]|nr:hypothetical protein [Actinomycetota bacterium]